MNPTEPNDFEADLLQESSQETSEADHVGPATPLTSEQISALQKSAAEAEEYKSKYLRNLAEMENAKKRLQKERGDLIKFANEQLVLELLAPLDNLENALRYADQAAPDVKHWAMGFQMILQQLQDTLQRIGAHSFNSEGEAFDPHRHEAVEVEENDSVPEGTILKEFVKGYKMGERVIRPARVKVAQRQPTQVNDQ